MNYVPLKGAPNSNKVSPEFIEWMKSIMSMEKSIIEQTESSKKSYDNESPNVETRKFNRLRKRSVVSINNAKLNIKKLNIKEMSIIDGKLPKVKSEKAMISFNEELSDRAKSSERLNQFLSKIENLRNLSPDEYTQQIMKLVDNRLELLCDKQKKRKSN